MSTPFVNANQIANHFAEFQPSQITPIATNLPKADDGSILTLMRDSDGDITGMVGTDENGVVHQMDIERQMGIAKDKTFLNQYRFASATNKFFENGQLFFNLNHTLHSNGEFIFRAKATAWIDNSFKKLVTWEIDFGENQVKVYGRRPEEGYFGRTYSFPFGDTPLPPYQDPMLGFNVFPKIEQVFPNEVNRISYFNPLFSIVEADLSGEAQAVLQAAGVSIGSISGGEFIRLTAPPPAPLPGTIGAIHEAISKDMKMFLKGIIWGLGGLYTYAYSSVPGGGVIGNFFGPFFASIFDSIISDLPEDASPPSGGTPNDMGAPTSESSNNSSQDSDETRMKEELANPKK